MSLVSESKSTHPPPEYKNNTVLFSFHVKKVTLKPWVTKYLDSVPLKLKWELESSDKDANSGNQVPTLLRRWESETFKLDGSQANNIDTIFLLAQTVQENDCLVLNSGNLKVALVIDNSTNVVVGTSSWNLDQFKVRSRFNPHSFELSNENKMFIGYVDIFYVSQQRWVRINKASLPMINKKETEYTSSPESSANTTTESERRSDDDSTLSCSSLGDNESRFSANPPKEDYVLIFWNSTNTCFVKSNPNDIQLQLLFMFIKTCLIDGDSPNSMIPFELEDIKPNEPFQVLKNFASNIKPLSYKDAKKFMHIPNSQRTSSNKSSTDTNFENPEDDAKTTTTEESNFEVQHSARLYTTSVPSTERLLSDANINDPNSFYNFISRQNKHFQTLLSKRFLSPTSSLNTSTNTSAISDRNNYAQANKKTKYVPRTESFNDDSTRYNSLPTYSKSIDTVTSLNDITHKTTNTMTTGLVSSRSHGVTTVDEESLTIGDATATTSKTLTTNLTFQEKYGQGTTKTNLYDIAEDGINLYVKENDTGKVVDLSKTADDIFEKTDVGEKAKSAQAVESLEMAQDLVEEKASTEAEGSIETKKSDGDFVTPSKSSITVYSIFSPKDYMETYSMLSESVVSDGSESLPSHTLSPTNLNSGVYQKERHLAGDKDKKINNYFKNVQHAYYIHDSEPDPSQLLSSYGATASLQVNRALHCERTLLNFETISKDLQTIGELKSSTDPELGSFDSSLIFRALQDAQILKVQGQTLPTSAYLKFFLKYLKCYSLKRVPIVVYLQIITHKQLETMNRLCSTSEEILNFTNVALEALIYELQVSTSMNPNLGGEARGFLFQKAGIPGSRTESDESDLFMFESEEENVDPNEFDVDSVVSGDRHLVLQGIVADIAKEAQGLDSRGLVYIARLNSPPVKSRGCIFRLSALKIVLYRIFCGRRKFLSNGHVIKL